MGTLPSDDMTERQVNRELDRIKFADNKDPANVFIKIHEIKRRAAQAGYELGPDDWSTW